MLRIKLVFLLACFLSAAWSQTFQSQITGVVSDPAGAVVPNARVTATNVATGVAYNTQSNEQGVYRVQALPPGEYRLATVMAGFKRYEQGPFRVNVAETRTLDVTLPLGDATEQVQVTAEAVALDTETGSLGTVISQRSIESLPLNVRDPLSLIALTPGVTLGASFGNGGGTDVGRNFFKNDFNVGGGRSGTQEILLDGAPNTTPDSNYGIINPPVDSVQEFKVQSNSYDAQFGRTSGGIINVITKSGTNQVHATVYEFYRNGKFDANYFFNNRAGIERPSFQRHQYGFNANGPIIRNRTFVFGDYEGLRQGFPVTAVSTVPTAMQRNGDFSQTFTNVNNQAALIQIYDPATLTVNPDGTRSRSLFPGNVVPGSRFDPVAARIAALYPLPNLPGAAITGQNNFIYTSKAITNSDKWDIRADHTFTDNTRGFLRLSRQKDVRVVPGPLPLPIGGGRDTTDVFSQGVVDVTHVFSPQLVGTFQFSASRAQGSQFGRSNGFDLASLGFPSSLVSVAAPQFPVVNSGDTIGTSNVQDAFVQFQPRNVFVWNGGLAYSRGAHNIRFGGEFRVLNFNEGQNSSPSGVYTFNRTFTQGPNPVAASRTAGFSFADFLLGAPATGNIRQLSPISTQGLYTAFYLQDDWRVNSKLTLNLGVRYDLGTSSREKYGRLAYFDPNSPSPLAQQAGLPNLRGVLRWTGVDGNSGYTQETNRLDFAPRLGFAYQLSSNVVMRGGYGIFYVPRIIRGNSGGAVTAFRDTPMVTTLDGGLTPANRLSNPFPDGVLTPQNNKDPLANVGATIQAPVQEFKSGYAQLWSYGLAWQLPASLVVEGSYWGNKGTHLLVGTWNINQLPNQYLSLGSALNDQVPNPFFGIISTGALAGRTISRRQSLLPFPQYVGDNGVQQVYVPEGNSSYHAATLKASKQASAALTFLAAYTFSKAIDDINTPQDVYNRRLAKALSPFDAPHQFIGSFVYQLPLGRNRAWGSQWHPMTNFILGGWDLNGILRLQSGTPLSISQPSVYNGQEVTVDNPTIDRWFNTSAFTVAPAFNFGNVGLRLANLRSDWVRNLDAVLVKNFYTSVRDREIRTQFRAEFFNVMNTPQFAAPNNSVTSQAFGQITRQFNNPRALQIAAKISF